MSYAVLLSDDSWEVLRSHLRQAGPLVGEMVKVVMAVEMAERIAVPDHNSIGPHNGTDTSRQAAIAIYPYSGDDRGNIFHHIIKKGNATCDEVQNELGMIAPTATARVNDLLNGGWLRDSGRRRLTIRNRPARVYVPTAKAVLAWRERRYEN